MNKESYGIWFIKVVIFLTVITFVFILAAVYAKYGVNL